MKHRTSEETFVKTWFIEALTYSFSINLSMGFVNAFLVKILGFTPLELGYIMTLRILAVALSQPVSATLLSIRRSLRKELWFIGGGFNRIGWALIPLAVFLPVGTNLVYLGVLVFLTQFLGGIAGVAAMDAIGDNVSSRNATDVMSKLNKYANIVIALSMITGIVVFLVSTDVLFNYILIYGVAFVTAVVSTYYLRRIPDQAGGELQCNAESGKREFRDIFAVSSLRKYLLVITLFNYAIYVPAPFWDYIVLSVSGGIDLLIPVKNLASLLTKAVTIDIWKKRAYRAGLKRTLVEGMGLTSIIPVFYLEAAHGVDIVFIEAISGVVWAPVDVGTSIYNIYLPSRSIRPVYISAINILTNAVATIASASGTFIYAATGSIYNSLIASATLRALTASLAYKILPDIEEKPS